MLKPFAILPALLLLLCACGGQSGAAIADPLRPASTGQERVASAAIPRGATIGPTGFATVLDAPPAPFVPAEPGRPAPPTPEQTAGHEQFARAGKFQNEVGQQVQALARRLRTAEKGNFVDLYYENEGEPKVVFRFLRDGPRTLAKYTRHPRFFAETARFTEEELRAAMDFMFETFREDRVIQGGGTGNKRNRAVIEISVTEPEFRALVVRKGVTIPEAVALEFVAKAPASTLNRPLPPRIAGLIRIFPRDDRPTGMLHSINSRAKVQLQDGCFKIAGGEHDGALVLFPLGARLFVDREGYLAFGEQEVPGYGRVGEELVFPGSIAEVTAETLVGPIREACGPGKVVKINGMRSDAADSAETTVAQNAEALRRFQSDYGLTADQARRVLERCKQQSGSGVCFLSPPPPPPPGGRTCPAGSKLSFGLCRTPGGYLRPIPHWIQEAIAG